MKDSYNSMTISLAFKWTMSYGCTFLLNKVRHVHAPDTLCGSILRRTDHDKHENQALIQVMIAAGFVLLQIAARGPSVSLKHTYHLPLLLSLSMIERLSAFASDLLIERSFIPQLAGKLPSALPCLTSDL